MLKFNILMPRFYFRLAFLPTILLTAVLLVIHAQPYDDHELRELLQPTDCRAPCFMGIRPGVTTVEEAVKLLEASGWVREIDKQYMPAFVTWKASPNATRWLDLQTNQSVSFQNGRVVSINLFSNFMIGDVRLSFNSPDIEDVMLGDRNHFYYRGVYLQKRFFVEGDLLCPASGIEIWKTKFFVRFVEMPTANFGYDNKMPWGKTVFYCRNFNP